MTNFFCEKVFFVAFMSVYDQVCASIICILKKNAATILIAIAHPKISSFGLCNHYDCF